MTFTTPIFVLFVSAVFALYWALPSLRAQNVLLLVSSYVFYGWWDYRFCALMMLTCLLDYSTGLLLGMYPQRWLRLSFLAFSLAVNLGILGVFKYYNFFAQSFISMCHGLGLPASPMTINIILPVGISFYTFQSLSYSIDVYLRKMQPTRDVISFLGFVSFFPQLVAGPIERATNLLGQFTRPRHFDLELARDGCRHILWGFFKKLALADNLGCYVDYVYNPARASSGAELAIATVCFAFQIYCDFSAYSEIAIGTAQLFGFRLMRNFAYPYFSQSISEFWRRWHISLSTWFRDYVYIPLGGGRVSQIRRAFNVMVTFVLSGFWHGAAWNYVFWGAANGVALIPSPGEGKTGSQQASQIPGGEFLIPRPRVLYRMGITFAFICLTWIFFRAASVFEALGILKKIGTDWTSYLSLHQAFLNTPSRDRIIVAMLFTVLMVAAEWIQRRYPHPLVLSRWPRWSRWTVYTAVLWISVLLCPPVRGSFIYFQF